MIDRIIIIGNGYDLSLGLKTSYDAFYDWFLNDIVSGVKDKILNKNVGLKSTDPKYSLHIDFKKNGDSIKVGRFSTNERNIPYHPFLQMLHKMNGNWMDIEATYFKQLYLALNEWKKNRVKVDTTSFPPPDPEDTAYRKLKTKVLGINKDLSILKGALIEYLEAHKEIDDKNVPAAQSFQNWFELKKEFNTRIVNFNYTPVFKLSTPSVEIIDIHNQLEDGKDIIFGYGDDDTTEYGTLSYLEEPDIFLENFKSHKYILKNNYRNLLGTLEHVSEATVYIVGHSCGRTDKSLLKAIFNHDNVKDIHVVYSEEFKNFSTIGYNIATNMQSTELFRKKMISKEDSLTFERIKKGDFNI